MHREVPARAGTSYRAANFRTEQSTAFSKDDLSELQDRSSHKHLSVICITRACEQPSDSGESRLEVQVLQWFTLLGMRMPEELSAKVAEIGVRVSAAELKRAAKRLSEEYRAGTSAGVLRGEAEQLAYLMVRMPATYAAVQAALSALRESMPGFAPERLVDLGAGPGTAMWAASDVFPSLQSMEAVEWDAGLLSLGRELAERATNGAIRGAVWRNGDLRSWAAERKYDLVIASYSLGELSTADRKRVLLTSWGTCEGALAVIEPGTRRGFEAIVEIRDWLIGVGAKLAAPCPHDRECPMRAAGDWCHFSARVERSAEHRRLKQGELGYEDEKFSYVIASKLPVQVPDARIVRHPMRYSGYTKLKLCTAEGLKEETVARSQKERYREAKRAEWGSGWGSNRRTEDRANRRTERQFQIETRQRVCASGLAERKVHLKNEFEAI